MSMSKTRLVAIFTLVALVSSCAISKDNDNKSKSKISQDDIIEQLSAEDIASLKEIMADGTVSPLEKQQMLTIAQNIDMSSAVSGGSVSFDGSESGGEILPDLMEWGRKALKENVNPFAEEAAEQSVVISDDAKVEGESSNAYLASLSDGVHVVVNKETGSCDIVLKDSSNSQYHRAQYGSTEIDTVHGGGYYETGHGYAGKAVLSEDNLPNRDADLDDENFSIWTIAEEDFVESMVDGLTKVTIPAADLGGEDVSLLVMKDTDYGSGHMRAGYLGVVALDNDGNAPVDQITLETLQEANYVRNMKEGINVIEFKDLGINVLAVKEKYEVRSVDTTNSGRSDTYDGGYHCFAMALIPDNLVPNRDPDMGNSRVALYNIYQGEVVREFATSHDRKYECRTIEDLENGSFDFEVELNGNVVTFSLDKDTEGHPNSTERNRVGYAAMSGISL